MIRKQYERYLGKLPEKLVEYVGEGIWANGLVSLCNPDVYMDVVSEGYSEKNVVVFAITAFGEFLVWENNKYVNLVSFSNHQVTVLESGFNFLLDDLMDEGFLNKYLHYELYQDAVAKLGKCEEGECYISSPIPAISGALKVDNLSKGRVREYNAVCVELLGKL